MYLIGRVISLMIFVAVMFIICYVISRSGKLTGNRAVNLYIILLGIMGYFFIPHTGADLFRLYTTMKYFSSKSVSELFEVLLSSTTPGSGLYFFVIGRLGNNNLLPFVSAIITFSFCFSILKDELKKNDSKSNYVAIALLVFMSRGLMMQIISNIRTMMALSICVQPLKI